MEQFRAGRLRPPDGISLEKQYLESYKPVLELDDPFEATEGSL